MFVGSASGVSMKTALVILFATIVTTPAFELQGRPKVLVYEVSEREGDTPHIELLKVDDLNNPLEEEDIVQLLQLDNDKKQNRGLTVKKNKHNLKRYKNINQYGFNKYRDDNNKWFKLGGDLNQFKLLNNVHNNYKSNKYRNNQKDNKVLDLEILLNNQDNQYNKRNKNRKRDIQRDRYINWDDQFSALDNQNSFQKQDNLWKAQLSNYIQHQSDKYDKGNKKNDKVYHRLQFADDNVDSYLEDEARDVQPDILSQILNPVPRDKRQAERLSILKRVKQLVKRLKQLDSDADARLDGQVYVTKVDGLSKLENSQENSELKDKNGQRLSIDDLKRVLEGNQYQNPLLVLRSGDPVLAAEDNEDALVEDRTAPPHKRDIWERDD